MTDSSLRPLTLMPVEYDVFTKDHVATKAGFVIGEPSVLVVESMLNGDPRACCSSQSESIRPHTFLRSQASRRSCAGIAIAFRSWRASNRASHRSQSSSLIEANYSVAQLHAEIRPQDV
jgi:hypothetical protein